MLDRPDPEGAPFRRSRRWRDGEHGRLLGFDGRTSSPKRTTVARNAKPLRTVVRWLRRKLVAARFSPVLLAYVVFGMLLAIIIAMSMFRSR